MGSTLAQLRTRHLQRADFSAAPDSDQQLYDIRMGCWAAKKLLADADPDRWLDEQSIALVAGTESYALINPDLLKVHGVMYTPDNGAHRYWLQPWSLEEHGGIKTSPLTSGTCYLWYVASHTDFSAGEAATSELPLIGEEYAITWAALQLRMKQEDSLDIAQHLAWCEKQIREIGLRDEASGAGIIDVMQRRTPIEEVNDRILLYRIMGNNIRFIEASYY